MSLSEKPRQLCEHHLTVHVNRYGIDGAGQECDPSDCAECQQPLTPAEVCTNDPETVRRLGGGRTESKHTPGPPWPDWWPDKCPSCGALHKVGTLPCLLHAAAPEMAEALKATRPIVLSTGNLVTLCRIDAALDKAGVTP